MPVEDFIIYVYCCVEDVCREVITMEIVGEFMGKDQDKSLWR